MADLVLAPPADIVSRSVPSGLATSNRLIIALDTSPESAADVTTRSSEQTSSPEHIALEEGSDPDSPAPSDSDSGSSHPSTTHLVSSPEDVGGPHTETRVSTVTIKNPKSAETFTWTFTHQKPVHSPGEKSTITGVEKERLVRAEKSPPERQGPKEGDVSSAVNGLLPSLNVSLQSLEAMKRALDSSVLPVNPLSDTRLNVELPVKPSPTDSSLKRSKQIEGTYTSPSQEGFGTYLTPHQRGRVMIPSTGLASSPAGPSALGGHSPKAPSGTPGLNGHANGASAPQTPLLGNYGAFMPVPFAMTAFPGSPLVSPSMNPNNMTGNYGPAAAAAAAAAAGNTTGRTVYVGNVPSDASVDELLNLVRFGPIENIRLLGEKSCVFISFLDGSTAAAFHADAHVKGLTMKGQVLKIGWGKPSTVSVPVMEAVLTQQATRNVFLGNLSPAMKEEDLKNEMGRFGPIDQVKIVRDKNCGFVHFLSISTAIKVVQQLPTQQGWQDKRIGYGKDRCAYVPKAQQAAVQAAQASALAAIQSQRAQQIPQTPYTPFTPMTPAYAGFTPQTAAFPHSPGLMASPMFGSALSYIDPSQIGNRTVYLGNLNPETSTEELLNNIRGGQVEKIRHMKEKGNAFVTFLEAEAAMQFFQVASTSNFTVGQRRVKLGWGKHPGPISTELAQACQAGASRNVYIGSIPDFDQFTDEKLRADFGAFGEIEMINFLQEKNAAFVNFTSIAFAQKAIEGVKARPEYSSLRISFGKDRCANPPRAPGSRPPNQRNVSSSSQTTPKDDAVAARIAVLEANGEHGANGTTSPLPPVKLEEEVEEGEE